MGGYEIFVSKTIRQKRPNVMLSREKVIVQMQRLNQLTDTDIYKKLSYRRETARQLPTWRGGG